MVIRNAKIYIKKFSIHTSNQMNVYVAKKKKFKTVPFSNGIFMLVSVSTYRYFCHIISGAVSLQLPDSFNLWGGGVRFQRVNVCVYVCVRESVCLRVSTYTLHCSYVHLSTVQSCKCNDKQFHNYSVVQNLQ